MKKFQPAFLLCLVLFPVISLASFIESTMGTAVVNDATAAYYNPAALTLLKNSQMIALGSATHFRTSFTGQTIQSTTGFTQSGSSNTQTYYYLPSFYLGIPVTSKMTIGLAVISNFLNTNIEDSSILRYAQSSNRIQDIDLVPAIGIKFNDYLSFGAGINISYANFIMQPVSGLPALNMPDVQSHNESSGSSLGGDVGFLLKPRNSTLIGFNYHSAIKYRLSGKSIFEGNPKVISPHYYFNFWTPARSVISINQFVSQNLGFIGTIQRVQWSIFKNINIHGIATQINSQSVILNANVPYHLYDTWIFTLGSHYRISQKWIVRIAGSYNESPGNGNYQISSGNSIVLGASMAYEIYKHIIIDGSYAHAFIQNKNIHITGTNIINGVNKGCLDAISLKLTLNL